MKECVVLVDSGWEARAYFAKATKCLVDWLLVDSLLRSGFEVRWVDVFGVCFLWFDVLTSGI